LFDVAIFSYEVGVLKPERWIFEALVKKSACSPREILYADDTEEKLLWAQELGITTFVFTDFPSFTVALKKQGVMW
jgi:HAD superfamily hydrolase (TIGR01509 family)